MTEGHNSRAQLRSYVERIERLEQEKKDIAEDVKSVYGEAKSAGYDSKVLRHVIKLRKQDATARQEFEAIVDTYLLALGMLPAQAEELAEALG